MAAANGHRRITIGVRRNRSARVGTGSDLSAQSDASLAAVAALVALLDGGPDAVTPTGLSAIEPSLTYVKGVSKRPGQVSVISASNAVGIAVMSRSGTCFWLRYSVGDGVQTFGARSPCTGRAALGAASEAWLKFGTRGPGCPTPLNSRPGPADTVF